MVHVAGAVERGCGSPVSHQHVSLAELALHVGCAVGRWPPKSIGQRLHRVVAEIAHGLKLVLHAFLTLEPPHDHAIRLGAAILAGRRSQTHSSHKVEDPAPRSRAVNNHPGPARYEDRTDWRRRHAEMAPASTC